MWQKPVFCLKANMRHMSKTDTWNYYNIWHKSKAILSKIIPAHFCDKKCHLVTSLIWQYHTFPNVPNNGTSPSMSESESSVSASDDDVMKQTIQHNRGMKARTEEMLTAGSAWPISKQITPLWHTGAFTSCTPNNRKNKRWIEITGAVMWWERWLFKKPEPKI